MQIRLVTAFFSVISLSAKVFAEDDIKRGTYPFMAFIYYQDETILGLSGDRFLQGAVLIRPSFLISSSPESSISNDPLSKTLLARLGATVIDSKFSLNEDEDEQEQEVIQITRPYHHNSMQWWLTDICLLKTLLPIQPTKSVHVTQLTTKIEPNDKLCEIIVFKKKSGTDVRLLTRMYVEMLPGTSENCGEKFIKETMACATDQTSADEKQLTTDFCHGNNGGPLICNTDVIALQSYINGECSPPHLYQLLAPRKRFLDCGIDDKCDEKGECRHVCSVIHKDAPPTTTARVLTEPTTSELTTVTTTTETTTKPTETTVTTETIEITEASEIALTTIITEASEVTLTTVITETTPSSTIVSTPTTNLQTTTTSNQTTSWPNELGGRKSKGDDVEGDATPRAVPDAQVRYVKPYKSSANSLFVFQSLIFNCFLLWLII